MKKRRCFLAITSTLATTRIHVLSFPYSLTSCSRITKARPSSSPRIWRTIMCNGTTVCIVLRYFESAHYLPSRSKKRCAIHTTCQRFAHLLFRVSHLCLDNLIWRGIRLSNRGAERDILTDNFTNTFLIRDPRKAISSFYRMSKKQATSGAPPHQKDRPPYI